MSKLTDRPCKKKKKDCNCGCKDKKQTYNVKKILKK